MAKNVDETKEAKQAEERSPWKDLSTAIMEERCVCQSHPCKNTKNKLQRSHILLNSLTRDVKHGASQLNYVGGSILVLEKHHPLLIILRILYFA